MKFSKASSGRLVTFSSAIIDRATGANFHNTRRKRCQKKKGLLTPVKVLNQGQIQAIHSTSLQILKKVGVKIPHPKILNLLNKIGAKVDENTQTVRFAPELVQECIDKSTKQYTLYGRNKEKKINFGSGDKVFLSSPGQYSWVDKDGKQRRPPKLEDARDAIKMGDALENIN